MPSSFSFFILYQAAHNMLCLRHGVGRETPEFAQKPEAEGGKIK